VLNTFQPMPELTEEELDALRRDVAENGILVPIVVDQHGRILDGHNRWRVAAELGVDCPRVVREVSDDDEAMSMAVTLNCARRHLTREQQRQIIANELTRRPDDSDRAIARRVGCSPSTVGAVRRAVSNLDTEDDPQDLAARREEAEQRVDATLQALVRVRNVIMDYVILGLTWQVSTEVMITQLVRSKQRHVQTMTERAPEIVDMFSTFIFDAVIDALADPMTWDEYVPMLGMRMPPAQEEDFLYGFIEIGDWGTREVA